MRHAEIEDGKCYALVRQGYHRESLRGAKKVRILDRQKHYVHRRPLGSNADGDRYHRYPDDDFRQKSADCMLAEIAGLWRLSDGEVETDETHKIAVKPAELFMEWDDFLAEVAWRKKVREEREAKDAERREAHAQEWTDIADRLAQFLPESVIEKIRTNAEGDPTKMYSLDVRRIKLDLGHLQEMAEKLEASE